MSSVPINKLYNLTCEGRQFLSVKPPNTLPDGYYSLVEICYTSSLVKSVKGIYVGKNESETTECIFGDLDLDTILIGNSEDNYLVRVRKYIGSLEETDKDNIIHSDDIIDFSLESKTQQLEKIFLIGVGSVLVYYHFMTISQESVGYPFHPVRIDFPVDTIDLSVLDQNVYEYLSYPAKILLNICVKSHGKLWMVQLMDFWNVWGVLFPKVLNLGDKTEIIYESIVGYSNHLYTQTASMCQYFKSAENVIVHGCEQINEVTEEALALIQGTDVDFKKKFRYAALLITTIATMVLKTIKAETDLSLEELIDCKEKCIEPMEDICRGIEQCKNEAIDELETIRLSTVSELKRTTNSCLMNVDEKIQGVEEVIKEIQKHLKIYATKNIQELHQSKSKVIRCMYEKIPEIVEKVRKDVDHIIYRSINKKIESKFSDVLCKYKRQAENRLLEVLNPVVSQKVNIFKEDARRAINQARSQAERARLQANRAEDLVMGIGCLEKRLKNLETGISETSIQRQIDEMKDDIDDLKDMVRQIARSLNIKC